MTVLEPAPWCRAEPTSYDGPALWLIEIAASRAGFATCAALRGFPAPSPLRFRTLSLPTGILDSHATILSASEMARAKAFLRPTDRQRYCASHIGLRLILGAVLRTDPARLVFASGPDGRPTLSGRHTGMLDFNLSHSGAHALIGLCAEGLIGVDIEALRPMPDAIRLAHQFFTSAEAASIAACATELRSTTFLSAWTCKEAVVKTTGAGLAQALDSFELALPPEAVRLRKAPDAEPWQLFAHVQDADTERALAAP